MMDKEDSVDPVAFSVDFRTLVAIAPFRRRGSKWRQFLFTCRPEHAELLSAWLKEGEEKGLLSVEET